MVGRPVRRQETLRAELEAIVGRPAVDERAVRDLWPLAIMDRRAGTDPQRALVVRPSGREQVAAVLRWAGAHDVKVTPLGGGSGVCGALSPEHGEIVLDMGAFDRIFEVDEVNLTCRCEAGVNGLVLEKHLNGLGLTLGHYPSSLPGTTVGGLVSTRSSGQESSRYGSIEDMVLSLAVVLPDGTFAAPRPGPRSAVGPALHELWIGAEGALGVVIGAVLRVHRLPPSTVGAGYGFANLAAGLACMREVMQSGIRPLVMRLYDAEDSAFNGFDLAEGGSALVVATAGLAEVAGSEAAAIKTFAGSAADLGAGPWERWQRHRFDLSAERLKDRKSTRLNSSHVP
jgi:alkyldihydroxyacetonephosphate synthase